jgi:hypothetical protein
MAGRKRQSYETEYGPKEGAKMHSRLQSISGKASQHEQHKSAWQKVATTQLRSNSRESE